MGSLAQEWTSPLPYQEKGRNAPGQGRLKQREKKGRYGLLQKKEKGKGGNGFRETKKKDRATWEKKKIRSHASGWWGERGGGKKPFSTLYLSRGGRRRKDRRIRSGRWGGGRRELS